MKINILSGWFVLLSVLCSGQNYEKQIAQNYRNFFEEAYQLYPEIPVGMLEAVAYTNTRINHIDPLNTMPSCAGLPSVFGVIGLVEDGKGWFRNNLLTVSGLSGYLQEEIKSEPRINILAFASAFSIIKQQAGINSGNPGDYVAILGTLSEIHIDKSNPASDFALNSYIYSVLSFLNNSEKQVLYGLPSYNINLTEIFGEKNLKVLSAHKVIVSNAGVININGEQYQSKDVEVACPDYNVPHCSWVASPNYSSRGGTAISAVVMHTVQGSYAGCISWFQNPDASASTHYVVRSSDGQLTQMVYEADKAWHVTTQNPYTVGYEHEGWVDDPSWYTPAMYQSSADLTRDICMAYGINTLRMFYRDTLDDGTVLDYGLHVLAGSSYCVKIAGHQHFPEQTHTDPGPYWTWDYYYKLVNNNPSVTTLTSESGTFYDSGGAGSDYGDDERILTLIQPSGAETITLTFSSFSLEANYDFIYIYDGDNEFAPLIGRFNTVSPGTVTSSGGSLLIEFRSDCATVSSGWAASWSCTTIDNIAPTTSVIVPSGWITDDFTVNFTDEDNIGGSGVEKSFYQVIDYDGSDWRANAGYGFFSDNFDQAAIHPDWTPVTGTWALSSGNLVQSDESLTNTNIYAYLNHTLSNRYLYHWAGAMDGAGTNRRAGLHYFCDQPSLTNRGNSYFAWFRLDNDKVQLYKVINDTFNLVTEVTYNFNAAQWYDYKVVYDRILGEHWVYIDDALVLTWTDSSPYSGGNYISLRSGDCIYSVNNLKVYRSRYPSVIVTVGPGEFIRYQNTNPSTPSGRVKSIVQDGNGNLSAIAWQDVNIDWTPPADIASVSDSLPSDIDTVYSTAQLSAYWNASADTNSDIAEYLYCIGSSPGANDVIVWTSNGLNTWETHSGLNLNYNITYYFSVKAINGAGLESAPSTSDGQLLLNPVQNTVAGFTFSNTTICEGEPLYFTNTSLNSTSWLWTFSGGSPSSSTDENPVIYFDSGNYNIELIAYGVGAPDTIVQQITISEIPFPVADFFAADTNLSLPLAIANFINSSTDVSSYFWDFGDGSNSAEENPSHEYASAGYFTVILIASGTSCGNDTLILYDYIHVSEEILPPSAGFTYSPASDICEGTPVIFTNTSVNATSFQWSFSGGTPSSSTETNPQAYFNTGTYNVELIAFGAGGIDTVEQSISVTVLSLPQANFSAIDTVIDLPPGNAFFINNSTDADSYLWAFGDGATSNDLAPWHNYSDTGYYSIMLIAYNNNCPADTLFIENFIHVVYFNFIASLAKNNYIYIYPNPFYDIIYIEITGQIHGNISFIIKDILGKEIFRSVFPANNRIIISDLSGKLSQGVYYLQVITESVNTLHKLIKE
ncbi:MAG: N-acetylmuramoyl-L-alanine amidase [Bacteroidia bacterium]|nr:N-acetylmuramoyl-L-alanine amidase [Bacteroidia bacterium]